MQTFRNGEDSLDLKWTNNVALHGLGTNLDLLRTDAVPEKRMRQLVSARQA